MVSKQDLSSTEKWGPFDFSSCTNQFNSFIFVDDRMINK